MFCEKCGKEITGETKFCTSCGAPIKAAGQVTKAAAPAQQAKPVQNKAPQPEKKGDNLFTKIFKRIPAFIKDPKATTEDIAENGDFRSALIALGLVYVTSLFYGCFYGIKAATYWIASARILKVIGTFFGSFGLSILESFLDLGIFAAGIAGASILAAKLLSKKRVSFPKALCLGVLFCSFDAAKYLCTMLINLIPLGFFSEIGTALAVGINVIKFIVLYFGLAKYTDGHRYTIFAAAAIMAAASILSGWIGLAF